MVVNGRPSAASEVKRELSNLLRATSCVLLCVTKVICGMNRPVEKTVRRFIRSDPAIASATIKCEARKDLIKD